MNSPDQKTYGYGSAATSCFHEKEPVNDEQKTVIWKF